MSGSALQNRVVVVVGAGSSGPGWGNGKACAVAFAREGAQVIASDINAEAASETVALIRKEGNRAEVVAADTTKRADVQRVVDYCRKKYGRIDVLHYNVGACIPGGCVELGEDQWRRAFELNVTGCFLCCKEILPIMEGQGSGVVLTTGSVTAIRWSGVDYISYYTTKAALLGFTRAVAMQYARKGVRAVSILPGLMDTPIVYSAGLTGSYRAHDDAQMAAMRNAQCPTGKMGTAWDVASAAVFLASDDAKYITGTEIIVDGGLTAKFA